MKRFFMQDTVLVGLVAGLGSLLMCGLLLWAGLTVAGEAPADHVRWFGGAFVPLLLVLRAYAKSKNHLTVTRTLIILFFCTFVAFMAYLLSAHLITFK